MAKRPSPLGPITENESIRIRKIDNGFIVSRSGMDKKGNWKESEVFSPGKPAVVVDTTAKPVRRVGPNALGVAMQHAKGKS